MRMWPKAEDFLSAIDKMGEQGLFTDLRDRIASKTGRLTELGDELQIKMNEFLDEKDKLSRIV